MTEAVIAFLRLIEGHSNYEISSLGTVRNIITKKFLQGTVTRTGYRIYELVSDEGVPSRHFLHRLVAEHFLDVDDRPNLQVNHKNRDKLDNRVDNLEWVTRSENTSHAIASGRNSNNKIVVRLDKNGIELEEYPSLKKAGEIFGVTALAIGNAARTGSKSVGFHWKFREEEKEDPVGDRKEIPEHPGYEITEAGDVWSSKTRRFLKPSSSNGDYMAVKLRVDGRQYCRYIHRLVALTYIPNDDESKTTVNHKDGNKLNNMAGNLEWISLDDNIRHAHDNGLIKYKTKAVSQYTLSGALVKNYPSIADAERETGINHSTISACMRGAHGYHSAGGFTWK